MTNRSKILLCRGCPRSNIPKVEVQNPLLPCDKLLVRFMPEFEAYQVMRQEFMSHPEYTHMVLATDDIIVKKEHIEQLQADLDEYDYPVLSGVMNVDQNDYAHLNITDVMPVKDKQTRKYAWYDSDALPDQDIFEVAFSGFPLMAIRRDIVEGYPVFAGDKVFQGFPPHRGLSLDLVFCWHCRDNNVRIMADKRINMVHRRTSGKNRVNKEPSSVEWSVWNGVPADK